MSRSHQRAEHILKNLQQEEEKRRLGREASIITAIPVVQEACYEPTCSPPPEQEEEGGTVRYEHIYVNTHLVLVPQALVQPPCTRRLIFLVRSLNSDLRRYRLLFFFIMPDICHASRRSGEPGIASSLRQPLMRLQQLPQELFFPPGFRVVRPLSG